MMPARTASVFRLRSGQASTTMPARTSSTPTAMFVPRYSESENAATKRATPETMNQIPTMITSAASALNGCFTRIRPAMMLSTPSIATSPRPSPLPAIDAITSMTPSTSRKIPMITAIVDERRPGPEDQDDAGGER